MKCLLDLSSCYRRPPPPKSPESAEELATVSEVGGTCDGVGSGRSRRKKSVNGHWRPELSVITEDGGVSFLESEKRKKAQYGNKSTSKSRTVAKSQICGYYDDKIYCHSRKSSMPMIIPAFAPTPFMF